MDDEQRKGRATSKEMGNGITEGSYPLPPRPDWSTSTPVRLSLSKKEGPNGGDADVLKATPLVSAIVAISAHEKSTELQLTAKDEEAVSNTVEALEQQPVAPFWDEKDLVEETWEQFSVSGSLMPHRDKSRKLAGHGPKSASCLARMSLPSPMCPTAVSGHIPPSATSSKPKWKLVGQYEHADTGGMEKSSENLSHGITSAPNHPSISTMSKHREGTKNSEGNRTFKAPNELNRAPPNAPTEPRSMRKGVPKVPSPTTPATEYLCSPGVEDPSTSKSETPVTLEAEEPPNLKLADTPKEIKDFQIPMGVSNSSTLSTYIQGAANDGSPLHIKGFPMCPQQCQPGLSTSSDPPHEESIVRGKLGCIHSAFVDLPCLSSNLPKEVHVHYFEILQLEAGIPRPMTKVPLGGSIYCQATGDQLKASLRWYIVTPNSTERVSKYFAQRGKDLESGELVPELDELLEATKASIPIFQCDQSVGDIVYIPHGSWYQVTAIQDAMSLRIWHAYPIDAITAKHMIKDIFAFHRLCHPATPPTRTMIYHYLRSFSDRISKNANVTPIFKNKRAQKDGLQNLAGAIKLFDRILAEEYTQGMREDESHLETPGFCDFCGADIFHAAFVCSSKFGLWDRSLVPDSCCEIRLCPSCCSEGRSCLCGNLRLCTVFEYDELVEMRNNIWDWCMSKLETVDTFGEIARNLTTNGIYEDPRHPHLTLGAISILNIRNSLWTEEKYNIEGAIPNVKCNGGALACGEHEVSYLQSVTCSSCHESICFKHLLAAGIHSWEAAFRWEHDRSWHEVHTTWSTKWIEWSKNNVPDPEDFLTTLAATFASCKPLKPTKIRLGFYDVADPSLNCARYEEDPILRWSTDKYSTIDALIPNLELVAPGIKALKTLKRKSETPGAGDSSDGRTVKRKKRSANRDGPFNPKPRQRKVAPAKASRNKSRLGAPIPVIRVKEEDASMDETDVSMDVPTSLALVSQALAMADLENMGTLPLEEPDARTLPESMHSDVPISVDTHVQDVTFSRPPSTTTLSSFDYSPEQSSSVMTPVELLYTIGLKDEMTFLRRQMELLLRKNEDLQRKVEEMQSDKELQMQAKDLQITELAERVSALEAAASAMKITTSVSPAKVAPVDGGMPPLSASSVPTDTVASTSDTECDSDSGAEGNFVNSLVPY